MSLREIQQSFWTEEKPKTASEIPFSEIDPIYSGNMDAMDGYEVEGYYTWLTGALFDCLRRHFLAVLPSGNLVRVDPAVLEIDWLDGADAFPDGQRFPQQYIARCLLRRHVAPCLDLERGVLALPKSSLPWLPVGELNKALDGAPICIREIDLPAPLGKLAHWLIDEVQRRDEAKLGSGEIGHRLQITPQRIVNAFSDGTCRTKGEAKRMFCNDLKHEAWLAIWREACAINSDLSKPGPRRPPNS